MEELTELDCTFDYSALSADDRKAVESATARINRRLKKTLADMVAIGEDLIAVKERIGHGGFMAWCVAEFGWGKSTVCNYMRVHDALANFQQLEIAPAAAIRLSERNTPDEAFAEAIERAESGETISQATAREIIKSHKGFNRKQWAGHREPLEGTVATLQELIEAGKRFRCVYADPPWQYGNQQTRAATDNHYGTMTVDQICAEPVLEIVEDDAHLHLWTTNAFLFDAKRVMEAWGFEYRSCLVWCKNQMGIGNYWRLAHEFLLLGIRGNATNFLANDQISWFLSDRTKHSRKPAEIRERIEKVSPGPRLEMYGREALDGWMVYGNQIAAKQVRLL